MTNMSSLELATYKLNLATARTKAWLLDTRSRGVVIIEGTYFINRRVTKRSANTLPVLTMVA